MLFLFPSVAHYRLVHFCDTEKWSLVEFDRWSIIGGTFLITGHKQQVVVKFRFYCTVKCNSYSQCENGFSWSQDKCKRHSSKYYMYIIKIDNVLTMAHGCFVYLLRMVPLPLKHFLIFNPKNL